MDLVLLLPGTSQDAVRARKANSNVGAGVFTNGSALLVDGVWNKEGNTGEPRQDFPQAAVREFKVYVSQSPAEYGWTAGGAVSFATKSGTNLYTGEAFEYLRTKAMQVQDPFAQAHGDAKPNYRRQQMGVALGGPVVRNRLHFFITGEQTLIDQSQTVIVQIPQYYGNMNGTFPTPEFNRMVFNRGDLQLTDKQSVFGRFAWQDSNFECEGCNASGPQPFFRGGGIEQKRYSWVGAHTWVASDRILNEVRGQWTNYHYRSHPPGVKPQEDIGDRSDARIGPLTQTLGFPSLSWGSATTLFTFQLSRQLRDDLTVSLGKHTWKFGGGAQELAIWNDNLPGKGAWSFSADQPFDPSKLSSFVPVPGTVRQYTQGLLTMAPRFSPNVMWDTYVQDEWRPVSNLTLTLGLRYEYQARVYHQGFSLDNKELFPSTGTVDSAGRSLTLPFVDFSKRGDRNNLGPRAGLAWDLRGGKTVLRLGYGLYYNPMNISATGGELSNLQQLNVTITNPAYPDPYQGRDPVSFAGAAAQNIGIIDNTLENLQSVAYTTGISQQLTSTLGIHVDTVYNRMSKVPTSIDINMRPGFFPYGTGTTFVATGNRALPQFAKINQIQSIGWMDYKALLMRLEKRFDNRYMYLVSYTLAKTYGNVASGAQSQTMTQAEAPWLDVGPSVADRRHTLVTSGSVMLPFDVQLGGVFTYRSMLPFSATAGIDLNGDAAISDYVPGTTRSVFNQGNNAALLAKVNAWRALQAPDALHPAGLAAIPLSQVDTSEFRQVDLRANKAFSLGPRRKIEVIGQVFNIFNRKNLTSPNTNALSDVFGTMASANSMRQGEIAVRYAW
jgi:hypothetical protein